MRYRNRTEQIINEGRTPNDGWTHAQLREWGIDPKNATGWKRRLIKTDGLKNFHPSVSPKPIPQPVAKPTARLAEAEVIFPVDLSTPWGRLTKGRASEKPWSEIKEHYGYIYLIESKKTGRMYVGIHETKAREEEWRKYMGSSSILDLLYSEMGKEYFTKSWLAWADTRTELIFLEALLIVALAKSGHPYLNRTVGDAENTVFRPKDIYKYLASRLSGEISELKSLKTRSVSGH